MSDEYARLRQHLGMAVTKQGAGHAVAAVGSTNRTHEWAQTIHAAAAGLQRATPGAKSSTPVLAVVVAIVIAAVVALALAL